MHLIYNVLLISGVWQGRDTLGDWGWHIHFILFIFISPLPVTSSIRGLFKALGNLKSSDSLIIFAFLKLGRILPHNVCLRSGLKVGIVNTRWRHLWKIKLEKTNVPHLKCKKVSLSQQWLSFMCLFVHFCFCLFYILKINFKKSQGKREMERYLNVFLVLTDKESLNTLLLNVHTYM